MLSSIKQVKVGRGIPMLCIRSIVHYMNIYSRIVIQLNMYVKIITSSGFKSTILTDFVQGQLRVPFRFGRCLKFPGSTLIYQKLSSPPQALRLRAQSRTQSNACARARMALALGKLTTGTPKFRGSGSLSACTIDKR